MNLKRLSRNALASLWGRLRRPAKLTTEELRYRLRSGQIKKVVFIRPHQGIGDLLLATPVFRALKEAYPSLELHFVGNPRNAVAVRDNPRLSKVWIYDKRAMGRPARGAAFIRQLRAEKFDLALVLFSNTPSFTSFLIAHLTGAPVIGSTRTDRFHGGTNWSRRLAHWEAPGSTPQDPEYVKFFRLIEPLVEGPAPSPEFAVPQRLDSWADGMWKQLGLNRHNPPIALFLGGNPKHPGRLWLPQSWARLARLILAHHAGPLLAICPPPGMRSGSGIPEPSFYNDFRQSLGENVPVFDEPGLQQAAAFLKPVKLFICPDGGLFHVAAASGVRTLGLFFSTDPTFWRPPLKDVRCLRAPDADPRRLEPEAVFEVVRHTLPSLGRA